MALKVGIDLVEVSTVVESLRGPHRDRYLGRIYTEREVEDCRDAAGEIQPERLAARFAAKEAAIKALPGAGEEVALTQIEVVRDEIGEVSLVFSGRAADLFDSVPGRELALSVTHERGYAAATVVIV